MCNQPLTTMMNNDYGDHDDSEMTIMLSSQFVKWLRGGLGLLFGIVALRALEARYLPPALLCHTTRQILLLCPFLLI